MTTVHLVSDPYSRFAAIYVDGSLLDWDLEDRPPDGDMLEALFGKVPGVEYDSLSKHQLGRKIEGFDWTEWESYWPENETDLPECGDEGCCVFEVDDAPEPTRMVFAVPACRLGRANCSGECLA